MDIYIFSKLYPLLILNLIWILTKLNFYWNLRHKKQYCDAIKLQPLHNFKLYFTISSLIFHWCKFIAVFSALAFPVKKYNLINVSSVMVHNLTGSEIWCMFIFLLYNFEGLCYNTSMYHRIITTESILDNTSFRGVKIIIWL